MAKNIVLCLDGTGNQIKARGTSNVVNLYEMLDLSDPDRQVAFYDPGVGTFGAQGAWTAWGKALTKLLGLTVGFGIKVNMAEAYTYLMQVYEPGDRVFVFGFSRGAYTARALAGMSHRGGLMRRGAENLVNYLVSAYTKGTSWKKDDWDRIDRFAKSFSVDHGGSLSLPLHFLGLWDSVKALGLLRWNPQWLYTRQLPNARVVRHAVSIDERRRPYREYLVDPFATPDRQEVWFAGVHSDVGGGFKEEVELSVVSLKWMTDRALDEELILRPRAYAKTCQLDATHARGRSHKAGWVWALLTFRTRTIQGYSPDEREAPDPRIHQSVKDRMAADVTYKLAVDHARIQWDDPDYLKPHPKAP
jgi:uncharacterized protein (DUF2235 family)